MTLEAVVPPPDICGFEDSFWLDMFKSGILKVDGVAVTKPNSYTEVTNWEKTYTVTGLDVSITMAPIFEAGGLKDWQNSLYGTKPDISDWEVTLTQGSSSTTLTESTGDVLLTTTNVTLYIGCHE